MSRRPGTYDPVLAAAQLLFIWPTRCDRLRAASTRIIGQPRLGPVRAIQLGRTRGRIEAIVSFRQPAKLDY